MKNRILHILTLAAALLLSARPSMAQEAVEIPGGSFHSILPEVEGTPLEVESFYMDVTAVINSEFTEFLMENARWRRSQIPAAFAGEGYLLHWQEDLTPEEESQEHAQTARISRLCV